jgi:hypothetical protein
MVPFLLKDNEDQFQSRFEALIGANPAQRFNHLGYEAGEGCDHSGKPFEWLLGDGLSCCQ